jgi:3-oxoacyl-[acyl-carrier protein] reductase
MDLGLKGRHALVCAASQGLGRAAALGLAREGVDLTIVARRRDLLEQAADEIRAETGVVVIAVAGDVTTEEGRAAALAARPEIDILVTNAGGPPPGDFRTLKRADWDSALNAQMLAPIDLIAATIDGMADRRFGRIVNVTSAAMRIPSRILPLTNGARGGLTAFVSGIVADFAKSNVTINNLLPGPFDTDRIRVTTRAAAEANGRTFEEEMERRTSQSPAGRLGRPEEFGAACAFLCSSLAGYMTGQNIALDGGAFVTTF